LGKLGNAGASHNYFLSSSEGRSALFVVAKQRETRASGDGEASESKSGYLTIIPVGADLKLPQQDIKVNWLDGRRSPDRDRPDPNPGAAAIFL
jgi:hypothetical protein